VNAFAAKVEIMQQPIKERIAKLREEIAQIREANRLFLQGGSRSVVAAADQERRLQRLQAIMDELMSLTDWKKV
jgi:DNA-binding MurR/RpiR family transcriptional regulator